jgi:phenylpropionate dioxygenase-like ring-hydroxylating dioxygenase large terminal subunit
MERPMVADDGILVSRRIFSDEDIYRRELHNVFRKSWLFLATADQIPKSGDYVTTYMGEDAVIVVRDKAGKVHAFINSCPHRGNRVCMFDSGNAAAFTCSYHGWSFNTEGALIGLPFAEEAYHNELDRKSLGLAELPSVQEFCGLIFGSWEAEPVSLLDYLGDFAFYLGKLYLAQGYGGLEAAKGAQRYRMRGNWKLIADNFAGDHYHTHSTHASGMKLGLAAVHQTAGNASGYFEIGLQPFHGLGGVYTDGVQYENDLRQAASHGPEVEAWVRRRYARLQESLGDLPAKPYGFGHATCFPNVSFLWGGSAFAPRGIYLWLPKGPLVTEVWQWCLVERDAPQAIKELNVRRFSRIQAAAGVFAADDTENFERMIDNTNTDGTKDLTFHYGMAAGHDGRWPKSETWNTEGLPGSVGPRFTEMNQRMFYRHWQQLMQAPA